MQRYLVQLRPNKVKGGVEQMLPWLSISGLRETKAGTGHSLPNKPDRRVNCYKLTAHPHTITLQGLLQPVPVTQ